MLLNSYIFYRNYMLNRDIICKVCRTGWRGVWAGNIWNDYGFNIFLILIFYERNYIWNPVLFGKCVGREGGGCGRGISGMIMDLIFVLLLIFFYRNYIRIGILY